MYKALTLICCFRFFGCRDGFGCGSDGVRKSDGGSRGAWRRGVSR